MNSGITVKELRDFCEVLVKQGYGNKHIVISDDDEGNGYHTLFFEFTTDKKTIKECAEYGLFHDGNNPDNIVMLG